jgi:hypothetical protein
LNGDWVLALILPCFMGGHESATPLMSKTTLLDHFSGHSDPRQTWKVIYPSLRRRN